MFGRKKSPAKSPKINLLDMPDISNLDRDEFGAEDDDDAALEAELLALTGESKPVAKKRAKPAAGADLAAIERMAAASLRDPSFEEDEDVEDDSELLAELSALSEEGAQSQIPTKSSKTLIDFDQEVTSSKKDIPPPVTLPSVGATTSSTTILEPPKDANTSDARHQMLVGRRDQYKMAAIQAKKAGNKELTMHYYKTAKQFDKVIEAVENGQEIDLSQMPPPPSQEVVPNQSAPPASSHPPAPAPAPATPSQSQEASGSSSVDDSPPKAFGVPPPPSTALEALQQRLDKFKQGEASAKGEGNSSKARRMGRIVKQFQDAIRKEKLGKPVDYDNLPCPPGFPPIPAAGSAAAAAPPQPRPTQSQPPPPVQQQQPSQPQPQQQPPAQPQPASPEAQAQSPGIPAQQSSSRGKSRNQRQLEFLLQRQKDFKVAALEAKQKGDLDKAKSMMRNIKGMEPMIDASRGGLPIDMKQIPNLPGVEEDFEIIDPKDCQEMSGDSKEMYERLQETLKKQAENCKNISEHYTQMGDLGSATKFDQLSKHSKQDFDAVCNARQHGDPVPRFHYEKRTFRIVKSFTELTDSDLEVTIVRGISYSLPSGHAAHQLNTYVTYELPYPSSDDPQKGQTGTVKHTNQPGYNSAHKLRIDRKQRSLARATKRMTLRFEVFYERGFLKSDKSLGQASMKLADLESQCEIHQSLELLEGRRAAGGKLEVKVRVREPIGGPQVEEVTEKWLVVDGVQRESMEQTINQLTVQGQKKPGSRSRSPSPNSKGSSSYGQAFNSIEVLKYELSLSEKKINYGKSKGVSPSKDQLQYHTNLQQKLKAVQSHLKQGRPSALQAYLKTLESAKIHFHAEAQHWLKLGDREKAAVALSKRKAIENEITTFKK